MTSVNTIEINASAADTWKVVGDEFVPVDKWMAAIPRAEAIPGPALPGAPAKGRNSYLIEKFAPMYQEEIITGYDKANMTLDVVVTIHNGPRFMPIKGYSAKVEISELDSNRCEVKWTGKAIPKWFGTPMTNALTKNLHPGFLRGIEELKHFMETGEVHPRKIGKV